MWVTVIELAQGEEDLIRIPFGEDGSKPLGPEERTTLLAFTGVAINVSSARVFPLEVFLMGGSSKRLAIHPRAGCIELDDAAESIRFNDDNGHELDIYREPIE